MTEGRVALIQRFPVKSMRGETLESAELTAEGIPFDRGWGVRDDATGVILSAKREPLLLHVSARMDGQRVKLSVPGEPEAPAAIAGSLVSALLGREVTVERAAVGARGTFEINADFEDETSRVFQWQGPEGRFHDSSALHLLTTASLRAAKALHPAGDWALPRFRPNVLVDIDGDRFVEDEWVGQQVRLGDAVLEVFKKCGRCVMTTREQPGASRDLDILRTLNRDHGGDLGVMARIVAPGKVTLGDTLSVL
jgi:hypothetical protein